MYGIEIDTLEKCSELQYLFDYDQDTFRSELDGLPIKSISELTKKIGFKDTKDKKSNIKQILMRLSRKMEDEEPQRPHGFMPAPDSRKVMAHIVDDIKNLTPRPSEKDMKLLAADIRINSIKDPIVLLEKDTKFRGKTLPRGTVIDGNSRVTILQELGLEIPMDRVEYITYKNESALINDVMHRFLFRRDHKQVNKIDRINLVRKFFKEQAKVLDETEPKEKNTPVVRKEVKPKKMGPPKKANSRQNLADTAGVNKNEIERLEYCEKWGSDILKKMRKENPNIKINTIWAEVKKALDTVRTNDMDLFEKVEQRKVKLSTAYNRILKSLDKTDKHIPGPLEKEVLWCLNVIKQELGDKDQHPMRSDEAYEVIVKKLKARAKKYKRTKS